MHTHPTLDTSDESKQHSKEVLDQEFNGGNIDTSSGEKNPQNVAGGLKAYVPPSKILFDIFIDTLQHHQEPQRL